MVVSNCASLIYARVLTACNSIWRRLSRQTQNERRVRAENDASSHRSHTDVLRRLFALKQIRKADMLRKNQEGHIRAERDLLAAASTSTRWTVRLAYSFQDRDNLYLVLAYMCGGDLLSLLIERDTFPEPMAKFYIAEMVLAISETHRVLGAIHRDVKPDNFLFNADGHLMISDFGLASTLHWSHDAAYFEQQRRDLLSKHGIDLEDGSGKAPATEPFDARATLMTDGEAKSILTMRDRNRRRMAYSIVGVSLRLIKSA